MTALPLNAHDVFCPACRARPGRYCTRLRGTPMMGYHMVRHRELAAMRTALLTAALEAR